MMINRKHTIVQRLQALALSLEEFEKALFYEMEDATDELKEAHSFCVYEKI